MIASARRLAKRRSAWAAIGLASVVALSACSSVPRDPGGVDGRLAVHVDADGAVAARSFSSGFALRGDERVGSLELSTPLMMVARAQWRSDEATLETATGTRRYRSLDAMAQDLLGTSVPMAALMSWLRGKPWDGAPSQRIASPPGFAQLGWEIDLSRRHEGLIVAARPQPVPRVTLRARLDSPS